MIVRREVLTKLLIKNDETRCSSNKPTNLKSIHMKPVVFYSHFRFRIKIHREKRKHKTVFLIKKAQFLDL